MKIVRGIVASIISFILFVLLMAFGIVFTLDRTAFNADFVTAEINKLDMTSLAKEVAGDRVPEDYHFVTEAAENIVQSQEPWLKEQIGIVIHTGYNYLLHKSDDFKVAVSLEPLITSSQTELKKAFLKSPPADYLSASAAQLDSYFEDLFRDFSEDIPSTIEYDETDLPPEVQKVFNRIREYSVYYGAVYWGLVAFIIIFILLVLALHGNRRSSARNLGITFLLYGAFDYALTRVIDIYMLPAFPLTGIPAALQPWVLQVTNDVLSPIFWFNIGLFAAGVLLLAVSFFCPKQAET